MRTCAYVHGPSVYARVRLVCVRVCVRACVRGYVRAYVLACMGARACVCIYTFVYMKHTRE